MNSECSICFEVIRSSETQKPLVTRCGHLFHDNCINSCLQSQGVGKCPQCNQPIKSSHMIRLYINEPENSTQAKDELIEQLRNQLQELNEKAQLQYDLIASLNRQIELEKELSGTGKSEDSSQPEASGFALPRRLVAPAKLNVDAKVNLGSLAGHTRGANVNGIEIEESSQTNPWSRGIPNNNIFGNRTIKFGSLAAVKPNVFRCERDDARTPFTNSIQSNFKLTSIAAKSNDKNANPLPTGDMAASESVFTFNSPTLSLFNDRVKNESIVLNSQIAFTNPTHPSFKFTSITAKSGDHNANPLPTTDMAASKSIFTFNSSTPPSLEGSHTRLKSRPNSQIAGLRRAGFKNGSMSFDMRSASTSSFLTEGKSALSYDWPTFASTAGSRAEDNAVQGATVDEDPRTYEIFDIDVEPTVPEKDDL